MVLRTSLTCRQSFYSTLNFNAPIDLQGSVTFMGLSVTDAGFGVFNFTLPVIPCTAAGGVAVAAAVVSPPAMTSKYSGSGT
jgi:hypothetical protein